MANRKSALLSILSILSIQGLLAAPMVCFGIGCGGPHATIVWHKSQPIQGEPEPRATLVDVAKYGGAVLSPYVAGIVAVEKIASGLSADWRTRRGETLLIRVPAPHGSSVDYRSTADGRPGQVRMTPVAAEQGSK